MGKMGKAKQPKSPGILDSEVLIFQSLQEAKLLLIACHCRLLHDFFGPHTWLGGGGFKDFSYLTGKYDPIWLISFEVKMCWNHHLLQPFWSVSALELRKLPILLQGGLGALFLLAPLGQHRTNYFMEGIFLDRWAPVTETIVRLSIIVTY